jgi:hypothetical protein
MLPQFNFAWLLCRVGGRVNKFYGYEPTRLLLPTPALMNIINASVDSPGIIEYSECQGTSELVEAEQP